MTLYSDTSTWISEEHKLFSDSVRKFYANELSPKIEEWNEDGIVGRDFWRKAGSAGVMAGSVPEDFGGAGGDIGFDSIALYEQAKTGDGSWGYGIQSIVIHYLIAYGNNEQKLRWLPKLVTGEKVGALAMTEPSAGSDVQSIRTTAKKDGNQYSINGSKIFITNGQSADLIILTCKTDKDAGAKGVSLILIDTEDLAGFERGKNLKKLGLKGNDTSELFFKDTRVPLTNLLGSEEGQGFY